MSEQRYNLYHRFYFPNGDVQVSTSGVPYDIGTVTEIMELQRLIFRFTDYWLVPV